MLGSGKVARHVDLQVTFVGRHHSLMIPPHLRSSQADNGEPGLFVRTFADLPQGTFGNTWARGHPVMKQRRNYRTVRWPDE